jgi:hypothetical protein
MRPEEAGPLLQGRSPRGRDVTPAALTAPAAGLFLEGVYYDGDTGPGPLQPAVIVD